MTPPRAGAAQAKNEEGILAVLAYAERPKTSEELARATGKSVRTTTRTLQACRKELGIRRSTLYSGRHAYTFHYHHPKCPCAGCKLVRRLKPIVAGRVRA